MPRMTKHLAGILTELDTYLEKDFTNAITLPPEMYTDEQFFELERTKVFENGWLCIGHELDFPNKGDYYGVKVCDEAMVIVRGEDNKLRALSSVCRHRYARMIEHGVRGNDTKIQCPYHRWTYALDGELRSALFLEKNECFEKSKLGLPEYRLEEWNGFVFVNLNDDAEPLAPLLEAPNEQLSVLAAQVREGSFEPVEYYHETWKCNWKLFQENNSEGYHHMGVHVDTLNKMYPTANIPFREADGLSDGEKIWTRYTAPIDKNTPIGQMMNDGFVPGEMGQEKLALNVLGIFPSTAITISGGSFGWYTLLPTAVDEVTYISGYYASEDISERTTEFGYPEIEKYKGRPIAQVLDEDGDVLGSVQESLKSGKKIERAGCLSWQEGGLMEFYRQLARHIRN